MRDPALHIKRSDLVQVLIGMGVPDAEDFAETVLREGFRYRILNRYTITAKTKKQQDKAVKFTELAEVKINKFNMILTANRQALGHKYIQTITQKDRDYLMLKEVATHVDEFCRLFFDGSNYDSACKHYVKIGLMLMGNKYGLNKFKYYKTQIFSLYENLLKIQEDPDKEATEALYDIYVDKVEQTRNIQISFRSDPDKYVNILYARQQADACQADYADWVEAQFDGLAFLNVIPEPNQLNGDNATNRYTAFMLNKKGAPKDTSFEVHNDAEEATKDYMKLLEQLSK